MLSDISLKEISSLEKVFLNLIDFDLVIRGAEYAKYYFILKTLSKQFNQKQLPMEPITVDQMSNLQKNATAFQLSQKQKNNASLNKSIN